jgi:hypothetical protein
VRKDHDLLLEHKRTGSLLAIAYLVVHLFFHLYFSSGSCRVMPGPEDVIAAVRCWYATHGRRPVGGKEKSTAKKKIARRWGRLLQEKLTLSADHRAEVEDLLAHFDTGLDPLVAWMTKHKRSPKQHRGDPEDKLAQKWLRYLNKNRSVAAAVARYPASDVEQSGMD